MLIITIRTDNPEAEIGLYNNHKQLAYRKWSAHRELAETLHAKLAELLKHQNKMWHDIQGVVAYQGPGSFTGLRIGLSVANALAYGLQVPVVATTGHDWQVVGADKLMSGKNDKVAIPEYGAPVHITQQKK